MQAVLFRHYHFVICVRRQVQLCRGDYDGLRNRFLVFLLATILRHHACFFSLFLVFSSTLIGEKKPQVWIGH
jgi:hypothetical protein